MSKEAAKPSWERDATPLEPVKSEGDNPKEKKKKKKKSLKIND